MAKYKKWLYLHAFVIFFVSGILFEFFLEMSEDNKVSQVFY